MLNDFSGLPEHSDLLLPPEQAGETEAQGAERACARFRASLWRGVAADIIRRRAAQETKGMVSC